MFPVVTGLGSKKQPVHCLVSHGSVQIRNPPPVDFHQLSSWLQENPDGRVEGIVWHCNDGTLIKVGGLVWLEDTNVRMRRCDVQAGGSDLLCVSSSVLRSIVTTWD